MKFSPPNLLYTTLGIALIFHFLLPLRSIFFFANPILATILLILGITLEMWAWMTFKKVGTTIHHDEDPKTIVEFGPYSFSRNPMYFGMLLMLLGFAFLLGTWPMFVGSILFVIIINYTAIQKEEKFMHKKFGNKYLEYKKKVGRWI